MLRASKKSCHALLVAVWMHSYIQKDTYTCMYLSGVATMQFTQVACKEQYSSNLHAHEAEHGQNFKILFKERKLITNWN